MDNKKIPTCLGTVILVIIAITAGVFIWKYEENITTEFGLQGLSQIQKTNDLKQKIVGISNTWTLVSHDNFWNNPNLFANGEYKFPNIEFSYPDNWEFQCCDDMNHGSAHIIYSSNDHNKSLPYIRITDYVLAGCPISKNNCSLDEAVKMTAREKFNQLALIIPTADILTEIKLNKLHTTAFGYKKSEGGDKFSKGYILDIGNDIIEVDFVNYELLNDSFILDFLNRISFETK